MHLRRAVPALLPLIVLSVGCSTERRSYDVAVENRLATPITFWLTKEYGPMEAEWLSPEQVATLTDPPDDDKLPDIVVPPGRTMTTRGPLTGSFDKARGRAYLRVYSGSPTLTEMLAMGRGSLHRADVLLRPGANRVIVQDKNGFMDAALIGAPPR